MKSDSRVKLSNDVERDKFVAIISRDKNNGQILVDNGQILVDNEQISVVNEQISDVNEQIKDYRL